MRIKTLHEHPLNKAEEIFGYRLQPGDTVTKGDYCSDALSQKWKLVPLGVVGLIVEEGCTMVYVRLILQPGERQ